jgi:hypothetical protein
MARYVLVHAGSVPSPRVSASQSEGTRRTRCTSDELDISHQQISSNVHEAIAEKGAERSEYAQLWHTSARTRTLQRRHSSRHPYCLLRYVSLSIYTTLLNYLHRRQILVYKLQSEATKQNRQAGRNPCTHFSQNSKFNTPAPVPDIGRMRYAGSFPR